VADNQSE
jgi:hypothetical protein